MISTIRLKVDRFFSVGHERTLKAKKNIAMSFLLKGASVVIGIAIVPMTINYVNTTEYGIWLTLSGIISWFSFFDVGLGNGLKNKLAEANAEGNHEKGKILVSTTYAVLIIISIAFFLLMYVLKNILNWNKILNTNISDNLSETAIIMTGFFCIQFVIQILNSVLTALHLTSRVSAINVIGQFCSLVILYMLVQNTSGSLINLILVLTGIPITVQFIASLWYYNSSFKKYAPSCKLIKLRYSKELLTMGAGFFIIQIGALILFQTDNIVITQLFGPEEVTTFNISYKLFSIVIMVFTIIMTPFWTAFTDAYKKNDFEWINVILYKIRKFWIILIISTLLILIVSPVIYKIWLSNKVQVPFILSLNVALYVIAYSWIIINCYFLNGIYKIRLQLYLYLICIIFNLPLAIILGKSIGIAGVPLSNAVMLLFMGILLHIQTMKIAAKSAFGIWDK
jgi:O-antigen/teichoic acid export membrane protein